MLSKSLLRESRPKFDARSISASFIPRVSVADKFKTTESHAFDARCVGAGRAEQPRTFH
jgi:hypothetical protein